MTLQLDQWPLCATRDCDNEVDPRRAAILNSDHRPVVCMTCGARPQARTVHIIDVPKSNPIVTSDLAFARGIGASHKGNRQAL